MTPQQLKNSILQQAIEGKLVEQRPEEGTGEELYQQIQKEKHKLIKEGKIKKEKPLPPITEDEIPFEKPESWKWVKLKQIVYNHGQEKPSYRFSYIDIGSIDNTCQKLNDKEVILEASKAPSRARKIVEKGDILYATVRPYLHNVCIIDRDFSTKPIASTGFAVFSCFAGIYNKFLFYYLLSPIFDSYANDHENSKGVAYPAINDNKLYSGLVPLPPLSEQKRIVAKIEELQPYIDQYEQAYNRLESFNKKFPNDMKKSILQMAIEGKLVEQRSEEGTGEELYQQIQKEKQKLIKEGKIKKEKPLPPITDGEIPFEIPENWKWMRLCQLGIFSSGKTPSMQNKEYWENGSIPWITSKDMKFNILKDSQMHITKKAAMQMTMYPKGTLLMVVRSGILKRHLPLCILGIDSTINQDIKAFSLIDSKLSKWIYYVLLGREPYIIHNLVKHITTVESLKFKEFENMLIPLPPLKEQKRIVAKVEELLPLCEQLKKTEES